MTLDELRRAVRRLELRSLRAARGPLAGFYKSYRRGRGLDFEEARAYQPGDDVRDIDWKVTARRGHPFVKRFVEERDRTLVLILDGSPSMRFGSVAQEDRLDADVQAGSTARLAPNLAPPAETPWRTKWEVAVDAAAIVALAASQWQDRIGCFVWKEPPRWFAPRHGERHASRLLRELVALRDAFLPTAPPGVALADPYEILERRLPRSLLNRSMLILISDLHFGASSRLLERLAYRKELVVLHVIDPWERELPNLGLVRFRDLETGRAVVVDTRSARFRLAYARQAAIREQRLRTLFARLRTRRIVLTTDRPVLTSLQRAWRRG